MNAFDAASLASVLGRLSEAGERGLGSDVIACAGGEAGVWQVSRLAGGRNNLVYRLTGPAGSVVAKFTIRDARDRAGREYAALAVLAAAGISIAPQPVLLDRESYFQPVVVQQWLAGEPLVKPPETELGWARLAEVLVLCHSVHPGREAAPLRSAVLTAHTAVGALQVVREELQKLPAGERPPEVERAAEQLERMVLPDWPTPRLALVRCDPNITNFMARPGTWACVDWEYSGWGDPAYDLAELSMHPSYRDVPEERWDWVGDWVLDGDAAARQRVALYRKTMNVWWLARLSRLRYETLTGRDPRLAAPNPGWEAELAENFAHYLRNVGRI